MAEDGPKSQVDKVDKVASERRPTAAKWAKYFAKKTNYFAKTTKHIAKKTLEEKYKLLAIVFNSNALLAGSNFFYKAEEFASLWYHSKNN